MPQASGFHYSLQQMNLHHWEENKRECLSGMMINTVWKSCSSDSSAKSIDVIIIMVLYGIFIFALRLTSFLCLLIACTLNESAEHSLKTEQMKVIQF